MQGELKTNHIAEQVFKDTNVPEIVLVRCTYFMENWTNSVETLQTPKPFFYSAITPLDFKIPMVAVKDIGQALASELVKESTPPTKPYILELHGPQAYTSLDVKNALSKVLDKDVEVRAVEKQDLPAFFGKIFPPQIVNEWVEMYSCLLPGGIAEMDLTKPGEVDIVRGKTELIEAFQAALK